MSFRQGARQFFEKRGNAEEAMYKELFKATVERTVVDIETDVLESIGEYAFYNCPYIGKVTLPNVVSMAGYAFGNSIISGDISMANLTSITGILQFNGRFLGSTISFPKLTSMTSDRTFYNSLDMNYRKDHGSPYPVSVRLDSCTNISNKAFYNCSGIGELYVPRCQSISGDYTLLNFGGWPKDYLPKADMVVGDPDLDTGLTMASLVAQTDFPFGVNTSYGKVTFYCKDGTVKYQNGSWVQTPYS